MLFKLSSSIILYVGFDRLGQERDSPSYVAPVVLVEVKPLRLGATGRSVPSFTDPTESIPRPPLALFTGTRGFRDAFWVRVRQRTNRPAGSEQRPRQLRRTRKVLHPVRAVSPQGPT